MSKRLALPLHRVRFVVRWALVLAGAVAGCGREPAGSRFTPVDAVSRIVKSSTATARENVLRIATTWPPDERARLESELRDWAKPPWQARIDWVELPVGTPLDRIRSRAPVFDVYLGWPLDDVSRTTATQELVTVIPGNFEEPARVEDPRLDPGMLAWAVRQLLGGQWKPGYARLFSWFGHEPGEPASLRPLVWLGGSSGETSDERHASAASPEGVAVSREGERKPDARRLMQFLNERRNARFPDEGDRGSPELRSLLADLLGSTLIDAREELRAAWAAVERLSEDESKTAVGWLTESPPWPPASVEKLKNMGGDHGLEMVDELANQVAPDPEVKFWLTQNWLQTSRPLDGAVLTELSRAVGGKLIREPRFRSWLGVEWTAWARQRYRRVARLATEGRSIVAGAMEPRPQVNSETP